MRVLVLGSGGMAGHVVAIYLRECGYEVQTLSAKHKLDDDTVLLDVTNTVELQKFLQSTSYDIVINCIGLLVKQSEDRKDLAAYLNSYLPHYLENFYKEKPTKLIHLSTDCVFSGKNAPYKENSPYDGELFYDRSKALGEVINHKDLTFRMSIIGPDMHQEGVGLFNWFLAQKGQIYGYTRAIWNGITTIELAKGIAAAIEQELSGLYHLVPTESISKYDLLKLFAEIFERNGIIIQPDDTSMSVNKTLVNTRKDFNFSIPDYRAMVKEMHEWINEHKDIYGHYTL